MTETMPSKERNASLSSSEDEGHVSQRIRSQTPEDNASAASPPTSHNEAGKNEKETNWKKTKSHFKKYPKSYALGVVLALAVILPLLFTALVPLIIRRVIGTREILLQHASVFVKNSNQIDFSANASVKSPLPARIGGLQFTLHDTTEERPPTVLTADIDGFPISKSTKIDIRGKTLQINDSSALISWVDRFIDSETIPFDVQVKGLRVSFGALHYTSNVNRPITINGLQGLRDITLTDLKLSLPPVANKNVRANITFSNPSSLTAQVGNITVDLAVNGIKVGEALAYNVTLVPGLTKVYIAGLLDMPTIVQKLGDILRDQTPQLLAGHITIQLKITSFTMYGERIEFLETLLRTRPLSAKVPLVALLNGAATGILRTGLVGMGRANGSEMGDRTLVDAIGDVLSNGTLMGRIQDRWNRRRLRQ